MALVAPLRGIRFSPARIDRLEDVVTPPYDVISEEAGSVFHEKNPYNMIQLDLRNTSSLGENEQARYDRACALFTDWQENGVLVRDQLPAIYPYTVQYTHPSGRRLERNGLVALVELHDFSEGVVKPHEQTFAGVIGDRLRLMETCKAQFSQIFSIFPDPDNEIMATLEQARENEPLAMVSDPDQNLHTLWRVSDPAALARVAELFATKALYIADGHHRYTTALAMRQRKREANQLLSPDDPSNFVMMYLCSMDDPGLSVLPTHRLVRWPGKLSADALTDRLKDFFQVEELRGGSREELVAMLLGRMEEGAGTPLPMLGCYHPGEDRALLLRLRQNDEIQAAAYAAMAPELRDLDVVVLSELVLHDILDLDHERCVSERLVRYLSDPDEALDLAVKMSIADSCSSPLLFLLNPTRVEQVRRVADQGMIMPHKSTFFYPKILTGLLLHKLDEPVALPERR